MFLPCCVFKMYQRPNNEGGGGGGGGEREREI